MANGRRSAKFKTSVVLEAIREAIKESPFVSEGYIKIWVRMRRKGKIASRERVLRIMRENELLSPYRHDKSTVRVRQHNGTVIQGKPDYLWGTDGVRGESCLLMAVILDRSRRAIQQSSPQIGREISDE